MVLECDFFFGEINCYQVAIFDSRSILMETNGKKSCTKRSRHLNIRYFYIKDLIDREEEEVDYCPTENMLADFFSNRYKEIYL